MNIKENVYQKLCEIEGVNIYFSYPKEFTSTPIITYYESINKDYGVCDREVLTEIEMRIDIWNNQSTSKIFESIEEKMTELGFRKGICQDIFDKARNLYRKSIKYRGLYNHIDGRIYNGIRGGN